MNQVKYNTMTMTRTMIRHKIIWMNEWMDLTERIGHKEETIIGCSFTMIFQSNEHMEMEMEWNWNMYLHWTALKKSNENGTHINNSWITMQDT